MTLTAGCVVLSALTQTARSERPELEYELAAEMLARAVRLETEELASMAPISPPATRGGRVVSAYTLLKQFRVGRVDRPGHRFAAERGAGDAFMRTAFSAVPADADEPVQLVSRFETAAPLPDTVEVAMAEPEGRAPERAGAPQAGVAGELAYAPSSGPAASSRFDALLNKPAEPFIPPLGANDHAWAATPLAAAAFGADEQKCLATGIYFEARGESETGQAAVAQVILNRVRNPAYPDTICGVVYQNRNWRNRCQFSFACDGRADRITNARAYRKAEKVAMDVTTGRTWLADVGSATHYHATYVRPRWARAMEKMDKIGLHVFYRTHNGGWN